MKFDQFELGIYTDAPESVIRWHWLTPAGLERWFLMEAKLLDAEGKALDPMTEAQPGMSYQWRWFDGTPDQGKFLTPEGDDFLSFTFGSLSHVNLKIEPVEEKCFVQLIQRISSSELQDQVYTDCLQGWTFYLANFKSVLEGGLDLREMEPDRPHLVNL